MDYGSKDRIRSEGRTCKEILNLFVQFAEERLYANFKTRVRDAELWRVESK